MEFEYKGVIWYRPMKVIDIIDTQLNTDFIEALKDWFADHYEHFKAYPGEFEYNDVVYDFDECKILLGWK